MMTERQIGHDTKSVSRHEILSELANLGVDVTSFDSFSISQLDDLLRGIKEIVNSYKHAKQSNGSGKDGSSISSMSSTDKKILKALISSAGHVSSLAMAKEFDIPLSTVQRRRKRLESSFVETSYWLRVERFGWRKATLFISTHNGMTSKIGKEILSWNEAIISVCRAMGENTIDLQVEIAFKNNTHLLDLIEKIKSVDGVRNIFWSESIDILGKNTSRFDTIIDGA